MPHHDTSHKREQTSLSSTATSLSVSAQQMNRKGEMRTDAPLPNVPAIASCAAQRPTTNAKLEEGKFFDPGVSNREGAAMDRAVLDQLSPVSAMMDRYFPGSVVPPEGTASGVRRVGDIPPTDHDESVHSAMDVPSTCETFTSLPDYHEEESTAFQLCEETGVTQKDAAKRVPTAKRSTHPRPSVSPGTRRVSATVGTVTSTTAMHRPAYKRPGATRSRTSHTATSSSPSPPPPASTAANSNHGAPATHCDPNATRAAQKLAPHIPHLEIGGATTARIGKDHKSSERRSTNSRLSTGRRVPSRSVEYLSPHSARGATGSTDTAGRPAGHHTQRSASQRFNHLYCPHKESVVVVDRSQFMPNLKHPPLPRELFGRPLEKIGCAARACFAPRSSSRRYVENESLPTSAAVSPRSNPHGLSCEVQPADVHAPGPYSPMRGGESYGDGLIRQLQSSAHPPRSSTAASPSPSYHPQHSKKPTSEEIMPLYSSFQFNGRGAPMTFRSHQFFRTGFEDPYNKRTKFLVEKGPKLTLERQLHLNARLSRPRLY